MTGSWVTQAACRGPVDPAIFFPINLQQEVEARAVCAGCPVKDACLAHALERGEADGIYGGLMPKERAARSRRVRMCRAGCGNPISADLDAKALYCSPECVRVEKNARNRAARKRRPA